VLSHRPFFSVVFLSTSASTGASLFSHFRELKAARLSGAL